MKIALTTCVSVSVAKVYNCFSQRVYGSKISAKISLEKNGGCRGNQYISQND